MRSVFLSLLILLILYVVTTLYIRLSRTVLVPVPVCTTAVEMGDGRLEILVGRTTTTAAVDSGRLYE